MWWEPFVRGQLQKRQVSEEAEPEDASARQHLLGFLPLINNQPIKMD
jgi:hypothetical protein